MNAREGGLHSDVAEVGGGTSTFIRKILAETSKIPGIKGKKILLLLNLHISQYSGQNLTLNLRNLQRKG